MRVETAVALRDVTIRRHAHRADVETCVAGPARRSFPVHLSAGLGLCVKSGPAHEVVSDGRRLTYPADAVCLRPPGCVWESETGHHGFVSLDIPADLVTRAGLGWAGSVMVFADVRLTSWAMRHIRAMAGAPSSFAVEEAATELVADLVDEGLVTARRTSSDGDLIVRRARDHLHDQLHLRPTLEETARSAGTDRFTLLRRFRTELGTTPHAYLVHARLTRAQQLLGRGVPLSAAAAEAGFADQAHLGRWFRRVYGVTPATYAAQVRPAISFQTATTDYWQRGSA